MIVGRFALALTLACGLLLPIAARTASSQAKLNGHVSNSLIIVLPPTKNKSETFRVEKALLDRYNKQGLRQLTPLGIEGPLPGTSAYLGALAPDAAVSHLTDELARSPLVLRAEPNAPRNFLDIDPDIGPLDEDFQDGYQDYYRDIGVLAMWGRGITGINAARPITIAVIDTGVDLDHPDIDDNLTPGYDFVDLDEMPQDESPDSHGSLVTGVIGAEINNDIVGGTARGVAGIGGGDAQAGTSGLRIMALRVAADSDFDLDCARSAQAIDYARTHGAQVINMSYGGEIACQLEREAIQRAYNAGIALVAGAGNSNSSQPFYPAAYGAGANDNLVIAVAGVYASGTKGNLSNYGKWVDICAPYRLVRSITRNGGYDSASGTSFSAPFVAGLAGLLMSNYGWSRDATFSTVLATADSVDAVNPSYEGLLGVGRINADRASAMVNQVYLPLISSSHRWTTKSALNASAPTCFLSPCLRLAQHLPQHAPHLRQLSIFVQ